MNNKSPFPNLLALFKFPAIPLISFVFKFKRRKSFSDICSDKLSSVYFVVHCYSFLILIFIYADFFFPQFQYELRNRAYFQKMHGCFPLKRMLEYSFKLYTADQLSVYDLQIDKCLSLQQ